MAPVDICGVFLGSSYLYDHGALFYRREHKYHLKKDGVKFIITAHKSKTHLNLVVANQMKQLISSNNRFVPMCVKEQHMDLRDTCSGCESQFKDSLVKKVEIFSVLFKEPKHITHKKGIQHEL